MQTLTFTHVFSIIYLILIKYAVACFFTVFSSENFTNIAWDSAGVTTGPVTVPFVLSLGIGFSKAKNAQEGFGILTCASVAPIITVLLTDLLRRLVQSAVNASTQRRLRRLISAESQTDSVEDLQLLLAPDSKAQRRGAGLLVDHYTADTATQCDLLGIVNAVPLRASGYHDNIVQLAASGDTSTGTALSAESPVTRSRRAGAQVCCFASIPHSMSTSGQHSAAHFGLSGCKEPGHKRRMSARHLAYD
jgi:hypothetical protein